MDTEEILQKAQQFMAGDDEQVLPEVIYHYCPFPAFVGIIESGELWLSHHNSMNDLSEARWFFGLLVEEARRIANEENQHRLSRFLHTFEVNLKDYFVLSFSTEPDVLSQWVMYADDGMGVAIGFHTHTFKMKRRIPYLSGSGSTNRGIFRVTYSDQTARQRARDLIDLVSTGVWGDIPPSPERFSLATKHAGFANEQEVRIVEVQDFRTPLNPDIHGFRMRHPGKAYRYRVRSGSDLIVYRAHGYREPETDFHFHSIWFGPQANVDQRALHAFLDAHHIGVDDGIYRSEIPYHQRT